MKVQYSTKEQAVFGIVTVVATAVCVYFEAKAHKIRKARQAEAKDFLEGILADKAKPVN